MTLNGTRPLVITDCDEVLLHMVRHFREWLDQEQEVDFVLEGQAFRDSMRRRGSPDPLSEEEMWTYLDLFFETEMQRQLPIAGAVAAINELQREADVVILTNLPDKRNAARTRQLRDLGIAAQVFTNLGPKGGALARIVEQFGATRAVFIDDIAAHHQSALETVPHVHRLHFCGEPALSPHIPCAHSAGHANARIDTWDEALPWIMKTLHGERA